MTEDHTILGMPSPEDWDPPPPGKDPMPRPAANDNVPEEALPLAA